MRSQTILDEIETRVKTVTAIDDVDVNRSAPFNFESGRFAANILRVLDEPAVLEDQNISILRWSTLIVIQLRIPRTSTLAQQISTVWGSIHTALMTDLNLGLEFVEQILPGAVEQPDETEEADLQIMALDISYSVLYRTSYTNLSA